ncbi:hypothetical protein HYPSUDRAFT_195326 [Hypholoma sublateritium FD-334 SS-4]|uniref:Transcription factor IIIC putative zinc-finger domain-containing protein n=1 Tax=Hypholoma sublateritium (strain FD-334 SS-4) TaxID=945553 RepID=A0A0D2N4Y5_HYPSF|nr:hypothetical protein HYPSUDRAFT_195326 [Hypholoma sublateritium FD-334 SS-4]
MNKNVQREKNSLPIFTTLSIPTVTSHPSLKTVQWSADGQLAFVTKNAVIVLTPDHGINFDNDSVIKSTPSKDDPALGWFKTMIQHDQAVPIKWPEYSQTWSAVSLGSIDLSVISLATSPSGISPNGGCIFATLSSNMDIHLWMAGKNYLKGEWLKIFEVTPYLLHTIAPTADEKSTASSVLQAQVVSIEWTSQIDYGFEPAPWVDSSLLILGTRSGHLTFLRHCNSDSPVHIVSLQVSKTWITELAFSKWDQREPKIYEGILAYGSADGSVGCLKIVQTLILDETAFSFTPTYNLAVTLEHEVVLIYSPAAPTSITALKWVHIAGRTPILVTCTPGVVSLWSAPATDDAAAPAHWAGHRSLRVRLQRTCTDSSPFHPVAGVAYVSAEDRLIVTLLDGSFHVVQDLATRPEWAAKAVIDAAAGHVNSDALSRTSRATFEAAEKGAVDRNDMVRIDGAVMYDCSATFLWMYESSRPSDFSYKHDAKHSSTLVVAQLWEQDDSSILQGLDVLLTTVKASSRLSPLQHLRPFLLHLRDPSKPHPQLLEMLQSKSQTDHSIGIHPPSFEGDLDLETRLKFRAGLTTNLFGWDHLLSLRMRLSLADFAWKIADSEEKQAECGIVAQSLLNAISHRVLRTLTRYLLAVVKSLTPDDIPFVSRIILQSLLHGCPADLAAEGSQLSAHIQPLINASAQMLGSDDTLGKLDELCPACGVAVPLQDITTAVCANGHTWPRCSVTTFILSTAAVRTCVGCSRKAFLPPSAKKGLPDIAHGWVVEELLEAVHHCLFCNNQFISIL